MGVESGTNASTHGELMRYIASNRKDPRAGDYVVGKAENCVKATPATVANKCGPSNDDASKDVS